MTNGGFLTSNSADGMRKSLYDEFTAIHVFNLRGNRRNAGAEGRPIFEAYAKGSGGSIAGIAIIVMVKDDTRSGGCTLRYAQVSDFTTAHEKVAEIVQAGSILGTNPHTIGIPRAGKEPLILDFATSRIAMGKVRVAHNKGEPVGEGILLAPDGSGTTDPGTMFRQPIGALLTFGEHKGSGISIMAEILSALLGPGTSIDQALDNEAINNNLFGVILDPARMGADAEARNRRLDAYVAYLKSAAPRDPARPVLMPGEPERASRAKRQAEGIPVDAETWRQIVAAGAHVGVDVEAIA